MWSIVLASMLSVAPPCDCGPGCDCIAPCACVRAVAAGTTPTLPTLTEGIRIAEAAHCDIVCYVGCEPPAGEQTRRACVYCRCRAIEQREGSGVVAGRWEDGRLGDWTWLRGRSDAASIAACLGDSAAIAVTSPANWSSPPPLLWYGAMGGCGPGGCGVGGCGPGGCGVGGFGRRR